MVVAVLKLADGGRKNRIIRYWQHEQKGGETVVERKEQTCPDLFLIRLFFALSEQALNPMPSARNLHITTSCPHACMQLPHQHHIFDAVCTLSALKGDQNILGKKKRAREIPC